MEYKGETYYVHSATGNIFKIRDDGEDVERDESNNPLTIGKWNFEKSKPELN